MWNSLYICSSQVLDEPTFKDLIEKDKFTFEYWFVKVNDQMQAA